MRHEKIFKRDDGTRVKVIASLSSRFMRDVEWRQEVYVAKPRKKKFINVEDTDDYEWRKLSLEDRSKHTLNKQLDVATPEEIFSVHMELYATIKPKLLSKQQIHQP